jgi:hypothetical protein
MKKRMSTLIFAGLMAVSAQSFAWQATTSLVPSSLENGWVGEAFVVRMVGNTVPTGCAAGDEIFTVLSSHGAYKTIVNMTIAAYIARRKMQIVFEPGDCNGINGAKIVSVRLFD